MSSHLRRFRALLAGIVPLLALVVDAGGEDIAPRVDQGVDRRVADMKLVDAATGEAFQLYSLRGKKAAVVVFLGTDCPVGNLYLPRLGELARRYEAQGVAFLGVNSNASESAEQVAAHAREFELPFPVYKDPGSAAADAVLATRTCETLVLDGRAILRYRGAIDDQYGVDFRKDEPTVSYLAQALDAVLAGRGLELKATPVQGCPIERGEVKVAEATYAQNPRIRPASAAMLAAYREVEGESLPEVGAVTYAGEVAAILQAKCQQCHRPGQVGPFKLESYEDARRWAASIHEVVEDRRMPPWHADPRYGQFGNDRRLTPKERATLMAWVEQDAPAGDLAQAPAPRVFSEGWSIGTPDQVFELPEPYTVAAQGVLPYQRFRVPTNFTEDRWIQAAEARPGDPSVVHHIIVYVDDKQGGEREHLCGYAPGDMPTVLPAGTAKKIPAGAELIFEMHYTPIGRMKTDQSKVGFVFAKEPPKRRAFTHGIANPRFAIPPGDGNFEVSSRLIVPTDSLLISFMPHMHLRGKDFEYKAVYPDGREEILLSVPAYDFNWQSYYTLAEPKKLPAGTRIECVAHFDNSGSNANLTPTDDRYSPNRRVTWGEQTWDEMMIGYIDYVPDISAEEAERLERKPGVGVLLRSGVRGLRAGAR